jgi:hypothetical protein
VQCSGHIQQHPEFNITKKGQMGDHIGPDPVDFFLEFFPLELLRPRFEFWNQHAADTDRRGWANIDEPMMTLFLAWLLFMGVTGLRRRDQYWNGDVFVNASAISTGMSQSTFGKLLYTIRDKGFARTMMGP